MAEGQERTGTRVVVVDDDPEQLEVLGLALQDSCYDVEAFSNPLEALVAVAERPPALVITDLTMPALSGLELIRRIRQRWAEPDVPVIVLSGIGEEETIIQCFSAGASDYLTKPITLAELRAKTTVLIKRSGLTLVPRAGEAQPTQGPGDELPVGSIFGSYRIVRRIGAGGMGVVYEAQAADGQTVALKVLSSELSRDSALLRRFFREAQHLKAIRHPNVVSFHDLGCVGNTYFLVMECVDGQPLDERYSAVWPLDEPSVAALGLQITEALEALRRAGMVHRDLKPANVMVTDEHRVKLIDFGLIKHQRDEKLTDTNVLIGTPHFIAPEQLTGEGEIDIRSDLYALGVILFLLLAGRLPFEGATPFEILRAHVATDPPLLRSINPEVSPWMEGVVARLLSKKPEQRFQSPAEVLEALAQSLVLSAGRDVPAGAAASA